MLDPRKVRHRAIMAKMQGSGGGGYVSQYQTVYDAMTNKPTSSIASAQNTMVSSLVSGGVWAKLDLFYLFAQYSNSDSEALINWVNPGTYDADLPTAPTFTSLEGFTGNGSSQYISTNWIPASHASNYALNDASVGIYGRNNVAVSSVTTGGRGAASTGRVMCYLRNTSNDSYIMLNSSSANTDSNTDSRGFFIYQRTASNVTKVYRNGTEIVSGTEASGVLPNAEMFILSYNNQGSPLTYSTNQLACVFYGGSLTSGERTSAQSAIETYMDSNGKGVI